MDIIPVPLISRVCAGPLDISKSTDNIQAFSTWNVRGWMAGVVLWSLTLLSQREAMGIHPSSTPLLGSTEAALKPGALSSTPLRDTRPPPRDGHLPHPWSSSSSSWPLENEDNKDKDFYDDPLPLNVQQTIIKPYSSWTYLLCVSVFVWKSNNCASRTVWNTFMPWSWPKYSSCRTSRTRLI